MKFEFNKGCLDLDLTGYFSKVLIPVLKADGRILGNSIEFILADMFSNLDYKPDNDFYDMDTPDGRLVEIRTKNFSFEASSNQGKNRVGTDNTTTEAKLLKVTDWLFVTIDTFPIVKVYHVTGETARNFWAANPYPRKSSKVLTSIQFFKEGLYE